jgi:hypothetical protein
MIHAIGDSFTFGEELATQDLAWPSILSKRLNKEIINQGCPGTGNTRIVKRIIDAVSNKSDLVVAGWTECNRLEFADEIGIFDVWAGKNFSGTKWTGQGKDWTHRVNLIKYMTAYDTPEYHYVNWLRQIILTQSLCKLHQIPCVMWISFGANSLHKKYNAEHTKLVEQIDRSMFVQNSLLINSMEWVNDAPLGPNGHPLELGHRRIADKIYASINR